MADDLRLQISLEDVNATGDQTEAEMSVPVTEYDSGDDTLADGDMRVTVNGDKTTLVTWLRAQHDYRTAFYKIQPVLDCPGLRVLPSTDQGEAVAIIERNAQSVYKGVLLADPPGSGKTLPAAMAVVRATSHSQSFSIIVVPATLVDQWKLEFVRYFEEGTSKVFILREHTTTFSELLEHDVVITSYDFVATQYQKLNEYEIQIAEWTNSSKGVADERGRPTRPDTSLFPDPLEALQSPYLVLDEANTVRDSNSTTFRAIKRLRERSRACIMLAGHPLEDDWMDMYALSSLLQGHPFDSVETFKEAFSVEDPHNPGDRLPPEDPYLLRLQSWMTCFTVMRRQDTTSLPEITRETIDLDLRKAELTASNVAFGEYERLQQQTSTKHRAQEALLRAEQLASHPRMPEIMRFVSVEAAMSGDYANENMHDQFTAEQLAMYNEWLQDLGRDQSWRSSRSVQVVDLVLYSRWKLPSCKIVIMDDSIYFLDIIQIALQKEAAPVEIVRLDGRTLPINRQATIDHFSTASTSAVLLVSRAVGGSGLNLQTANVLILSNLFEHASHVEQAIGQLWRHGQTRPVRVFELYAVGGYKIVKMQYEI